MISSAFKYLSTVLVLGSILGGSGFSQNVDQGSLTELDERIQAIGEIGLIKGFGLSIFSEGEVYFSKGYGYADTDKQLPYTPETLQNIGSVSKTLIGISLLKAQELGLLNLDDPTSDYLDFGVENPYFPGEPITIRQLATHTFTIKDTDLYDQKAYYLLDADDKDAPTLVNQSEVFHVYGEQASMQEYLTYFLSPEGKWYSKKNFLKKKAGTKYEYSNVGAALAAYVIEKATNISYQEFTRKHILSPLGMNASGWSYDDIEEANHS
ncbi:MAG: serine hydrolase, partial [Bacteroidota bacterium]